MFEVAVLWILFSFYVFAVLWGLIVLYGRFSAAGALVGHPRMSCEHAQPGWGPGIWQLTRESSSWTA